LLDEILSCSCDLCAAPQNTFIDHEHNSHARIVTTCVVRAEERMQFAEFGTNREKTKD
jgi:hypothetical protein